MKYLASLLAFPPGVRERLMAYLAASAAFLSDAYGRAIKYSGSWFDALPPETRERLWKYRAALSLFLATARERLIKFRTWSVERLSDAGEDLATEEKHTSVYVYEVPVRLWHWINAAAILVLCATGWFIGNPPPSMQIAEATDQFVFGYLRFAHFAAAMAMTVGFFVRIYWAFIGNRHARQLFWLPILNKQWRSEVLFEIRWYMFLEKEPKKYVGHNPLAQIAMFIFMTCGMTFMIVTGFALYAEGLGADHWLSVLTAPVMNLAGNSQAMHSLHRLGMWAIVIFVMIHIYVAIREDIMSRQSIVSAMISGYRTFKDGKP